MNVYICYIQTFVDFVNVYLRTSMLSKFVDVSIVPMFDSYNAAINVIVLL